MSPRAPIPLTQGLNQSLIPHAGKLTPPTPVPGKPHTLQLVWHQLWLCQRSQLVLLTAEGAQGRGFGGGDGGQDPRLCCWKLLIAAG